MTSRKSAPNSAFNWRSGYVPQIDWRGFGVAAAKSGAASALVERKAAAGVSMGSVLRMSAPPERPLITHTRAGMPAKKRGAK